MAARTVCDYCRADLDLGREFAYRYEAEGGDLDPTACAGGSLRVCRACQAGIEANAKELAGFRRDEDADRFRSQRLLFVACAVTLAVLLTGWLSSDPRPAKFPPRQFHEQAGSSP